MAKPAQCDRLKAGGSFKMQEFMYSLNATLPVFFVMLLGWLLKQKGMLNENFSKVGNAFVFGVALPVLLFKSAY
ncbi:MAG: AEC family transporter, partial [Pygmaiobacter sp.]